MSHIKKIVEWNDIAEVPVDDKSRALYIKLIMEELKEMIMAFVTQNEKEVADGAVDLVWVLVGFLRASGHNVEALFDEVERSNYSKFVRALGGNYKCMKREDGKILKPDSFHPVNFNGLINEKQDKEKNLQLSLFVWDEIGDISDICGNSINSKHR